MGKVVTLMNEMFIVQNERIFKDVFSIETKKAYTYKEILKFVIYGKYIKNKLAFVPIEGINGIFKKYKRAK